MPADKSDYLIRPATPDDVPALVEMRLAIQEHITRANGHVLPLRKDSRTWLAESYLATLADAQTRVVVAEEPRSGSSVGMAVGRVVAHEGLVPPRTGKIDDVWVRPEFRRRGICRLMVRDLLEFFRRLDLEKVVLDYILGEKNAESLWRRFGFHPVLTIATGSLAEVTRRFATPADAAESSP